MAVSQSTVASRLMSISEASNRFRLHPNTFRNATNSGRLKCFTLPSGHRRFSEAHILEWMGEHEQGEERQVENGQGSASIPVAICVRVSSAHQATASGNAEKSSLQHQEERCREFVRSKFGDRASVTLYSRVASGMSFDNQVLLRMITDIIEGKFKNGYLVASSADRLVRFGGKLINYLCELGGCKILYVLEGEDQTEGESLTADILACLTHYTAKASGLKTKKLQKVWLDPQSLLEATELYKQGMSLKDISRKFTDEGRADEKGRKYSLTVLWKNLKESGAIIKVLNSRKGARLPVVQSETNSFRRWLKERVRKSVGNKLERSEAMLNYTAFCLEKGIHPITCRNKLSKLVKEANIRAVAHYRTDRISWLDVALKN